MALQTEYFSMQGRIYIGPRNADGTRAPARWVYDSSVLNWTQTVESETITESWSGNRGVAARLTNSRQMTVNLNLRQLNLDNAALALQGVRVDIPSGTVLNETIGDVAPGNVVALEYAAVSALTLVDGAAAALVEDTDYTSSLSTGVITFLTTKTGVKASTYTYAAHSLVTALNGGSKDYYLLFDGVNTVDGTTTKCLGEVYKINFSPASEFGYIQDSFGEMAIEGEALVDSVRQSDPKWGPFARVKLIGPA